MLRMPYFIYIQYVCCYAKILVSAIKYGHLIPTPVQETEIKFIVVIWIQGTASEIGNSDSWFAGGLKWFSMPLNADRFLKHS
jgi:hypothetical protein